MISKFLGFLAHLVISCISATGYGGVFVLMFFESCGILAPSEVIMPFAGYLVATGRFGLWPVVLAGSLGNIFGSILAYWIGARGGRPLLERYGKYLGISAHDIDRSDHWFARYGELAVFVGRLLPVVRTYISFPAGAAKMNFKKFILYTTLGVIPWVFLFAWLGKSLGPRWNSIHEELRFLDAVVVIGIGFLSGYLLYKKIKRGNKKTAERMR